MPTKLKDASMSKIIKTSNTEVKMLMADGGFSTHTSKSFAFCVRARLAVSLNCSTSLRLFESHEIEAVQFLHSQATKKPGIKPGTFVAEHMGLEPFNGYK